MFVFVCVCACVYKFNVGNNGSSGLLLASSKLCPLGCVECYRLQGSIQDFVEALDRRLLQVFHNGGDRPLYRSEVAVCVYAQLFFGIDG